MTFLSRSVYPATPAATADFAISWSYLSTAHVEVRAFDPALDVLPEPLVQGVDYNFTSASVIHWLVSRTDGWTVDIRRNTPRAITALASPSSLTAADLNARFTQLLYVAQELEDTLAEVPNVAVEADVVAAQLARTRAEAAEVVAMAGATAAALSEANAASSANLALTAQAVAANKIFDTELQGRTYTDGHAGVVDETIYLVKSGVTSGAIDMYLFKGIGTIGTLRKTLPAIDLLASGAETLVGFQTGGGSAVKALSPAGFSSAVEALGVFLHRTHFVRPTKLKPYVGMKMSATRWWVVTFASGGGRGDYIIMEMCNAGADVLPVVTDNWAFRGAVALLNGLWECVANFTGENVGGGIMDSMPPPVFEPVGHFGLLGQALDFISSRHGHVTTPGSVINLNGSGATNYRLAANSPIGTVIRGTALLWDQTFACVCPHDNVTPLGNLSIGHSFIPGGVNIVGTLTITGTNIVCDTFYGGLFSGFGDTFKGKDKLAIAATHDDNLEYGLNVAGNAALAGANYGEVDTMAFYNASRPTSLWECIFPGGAPLAMDGGAYSWAENGTNRDVWVQNRDEGYSKVYIEGFNKSAPQIVDGRVFAFNVKYRARIGAAL